MCGGENVGSCFHEDPSIRIRTAASAGPGERSHVLRSQSCPPQNKETREGGEGRGSGSQEEKHRPERRSLPGAAAAAAPRSRNLRGAGGMPGGMMAG